MTDSGNGEPQVKEFYFPKVPSLLDAEAPVQQMQREEGGSSSPPYEDGSELLTTAPVSRDGMMKKRRPILAPDPDPRSQFINSDPKKAIKN